MRIISPPHLHPVSALAPHLTLHTHITMNLVAQLPHDAVWTGYRFARIDNRSIMINLFMHTFTLVFFTHHLTGHVFVSVEQVTASLLLRDPVSSLS